MPEEKNQFGEIQYLFSYEITNHHQVTPKEAKNKVRPKNPNLPRR